MTSDKAWPSQLATAIAGLLALLVLFPFVYGFVAAMLSPADVMARTPSYWPLHPENFLRVFEAQPFHLFLLNSLLLATATTAGVMSTSILAAYAFARMEFRGSNILFVAVVGAMMIPTLITVIPNYLFMARLNLIPGRLAAILPTLASGFTTFFLRQHFKAIPRAFDEAAQLDGAGTFRILVEIIIPLARPAIAAMAVFAFLAEWNSYLWPLIVLDGDQRTVQIGLAHMQAEVREQPLTDWPLILAASCVTLVPSFLLFIAAERHIVRGAGLSVGK
jgi:multiple sugar transport system permease protein/sn-glycerol 3-phosphate transport system permease protein